MNFNSVKKKKPKSGKCYAIQLPITTSKAYSYFWIEYFSEIMYVKILNNVYFKCVFFFFMGGSKKNREQGENIKVASLYLLLPKDCRFGKILNSHNSFKCKFIVHLFWRTFFFNLAVFN